MKRVYYYKDGDIIKKFVYCSMCGAGPYKQEDESYEFIRLGGEKTPLNYCKYCAQMRNYKLLKRSETEIKSDILESQIIELVPELPEIPEKIFDIDLFEPQKENKSDPQETIENKSKIIENKTLEDTIYFIVVKCKDGSFYSSVTGLSIEKSLKNMNVGKGPNYTKPYNRRPVSLLLSLKINKLEGNELKKQFDSWSITAKKKYIKEKQSP